MSVSSGSFDDENSSTESLSNPPYDSTTADIASKETTFVNRVRVLVFAVFFLSITAIAVVMYYFTRTSETNQFEIQFQDDAEKILESIGTTFEQTLNAIDSFATSLISHAHATNQTWPFVTIPDFPLRGAKLRSAMLGYGVFVQPFVTPDQRIEWESYANDNRGWVNESLRQQAHDKNFYGPIIYLDNPELRIFGNDGDIPYNSTRLMLPTWQSYPAVQRYYIAYNWDWLSVLDVSNIEACREKRKAVLGEALMLADPNIPEEVAESKVWEEWYKDYIRPDEEPNAPASDLHYPIIDQLDSIETITNRSTSRRNVVVGTVGTSIYWREFLQNILPDLKRGLVVVFKSPCNPTFTYQVNGPNPVYLGRGDHHDSKYDRLCISHEFVKLASLKNTASKYYGAPLDDTYCPVTINVYPSDTMKDDSTTSNPIIFTVVTVVIFGFTLFVFFFYDKKVETRQAVVINTAMKTNAIVSSLFPASFRDQVISYESNKSRTSRLNASTNHNSDYKRHTIHSSKPLANLYPDTTVFFADLAGFTAWSSEREPCQVFTLLETLYASFDKAASLRRVFKVETIGDCYVAVTGLPDPNKNHAVVMVKFAKCCVIETRRKTEILEKCLGPGTVNLKLRVGLHSGPTIAGVLRGDKSRFQLFGDTVNTASRMESTGVPGKIHISNNTASLLATAGKHSWITEREKLITVKGKGAMTTFFAWPKASSTKSIAGVLEDMSRDQLSDCVDDSLNRTQRLQDWCTEIFINLLEDVLSKRKVTSGSVPQTDMNNAHNIGRIPLDDLYEHLDLPELLSDNLENFSDPMMLQEGVKRELRTFISNIAFLHRENAFHNFEHACHVVMSANKLLQRISLPSNNSSRLELDEFSNSSCSVGLDPLTRFGVVFAAFIRNIDHLGLSNSQLVQQKQSMAQLYKETSVAEQNAIDISWSLLMQPSFSELRNCIFSSEIELKLFRQVVIHCVLATDNTDINRKHLQESRWAKVFRDKRDSEIAIIKEDLNCMKTVVIEHIIMASEVAYTMQHWDIYIKWNIQLFHEKFIAYQLGYTEKNPADSWYEEELDFFDKYVIPLATRLRKCLPCDEFLDYSLSNHHEWKIKGPEITRNISHEFMNAWTATQNS